MNRPTRQNVATGLIMIGLGMSAYPGLPWCSLMLIGLLLHGHVRERLQPLLHRFGPGLLLLGLSLMPGLLSAGEGFTALKATADVLRGFVAGLAVWLVIDDRTQATWLTRCLLVALASLVCLHASFADSLLRTETIRHLQIVYFGHPARLAAVMALLILVLRAAHLRHDGLLSRRTAAAIALSGMLVWGWASSRGPLLMLLLGLPLSWLILRASGKGLLVGSTATLAMTPALLVVIGQLLGRGTADSGRFELWSHTISLWQTSPWIGLGNNLFKTFPNAHLQGSQLLMPHNIYLEALFSGGVIGSVLFVGGLVWIVWLARCNRTHFFAESLSCLLFFLLLGLVDTKLMSNLGGFELGLSLVLLFAGYRPVSGHTAACQKPA